MNIRRQIAENRRRAISQSLDLFIIIAAVLAVGGVVTAAIYGLAGSATANSSIQVTSVLLTGGSTSTSSPVAFAITIKNTGTSTITCTASTCLVTFAGTNTGTSTAPACAAQCAITSSPTGWTLSAPGGGAPAAGNPLVFSAGTMTLAPGAETSLVLTGPLSAIGTSPTFPVHGSTTPQTINIVFGTASASTSAQP